MLFKSGEKRPSDVVSVVCGPFVSCSRRDGIREERRKVLYCLRRGRTSRKRSGRWSGILWWPYILLYKMYSLIEKRKEEEGGETRWPETKRSLNRQRELLRWRRGKRTLKKSLFSLHFGGDSCHDIQDQTCVYVRGKNEQSRREPGGLAERQEKHREMESGSFVTVSNDGECLCHLKKRREFKTQETISRERKEKRRRRRRSRK